MLTGSITGGEALRALAERIGRLRDVDLAPLARRVAGIVADDLRANIASGTTVDGGAMAPLAASTLRRRRGASTPGGGPASGLIRDLAVDIRATGPP